MNPDNKQSPLSPQPDSDTGSQFITPSEAAPQVIHPELPNPTPRPVIVTPTSAPQTSIQATPPVVAAMTPVIQTNGPFISPNSMPLPSKKVSPKFVLVGIAAFILLVGGASLVVKLAHSKKSPPVKGAAALIYNDAQVKKLAQNKQLTPSTLTTIDKTNAFYSAFRLAAERPIVQTTWDVYNTSNQTDARPAQYTLSVTSVNYTSKEYTYDRDEYTTTDVTLSRCGGGPTKNSHNVFDPVRSTATVTYWPIGDTVSCAFAAASTRMSDGMNTGGLTTQQSDTFVQKLHSSGALSVNSVSLIPHAGTQYLQFDVTLTPQPKNGKTYSGMQNFMDAFTATGLNAATYPYAYFGASGEGMHLQYYVDPATMLPVYSTAVSTPMLDASGKPVKPTSWSHRYIEYTFPSAIMDDVLDPTHLTFSSWPDH